MGTHVDCVQEVAALIPGIPVCASLLFRAVLLYLLGSRRLHKTGGAQSVHGFGRP